VFLPNYWLQALQPIFASLSPSYLIQWVLWHLFTALSPSPRAQQALRFLLALLSPNHLTLQALHASVLSPNLLV